MDVDHNGEKGRPGGGPPLERSNLDALRDRLIELFRDLHQKIIEFDQRRAQHASPKIRIYDKSSLRSPTREELGEERKKLERMIKRVDALHDDIDAHPVIAKINLEKRMDDPNFKGVAREFVFKSMTQELVKAKEQLREMSLEKRLEKGYFIRIRENSR